MSDEKKRELVHWTGGHDAAFLADPDEDTVWGTQAQIAKAFGVTNKTVSEHLTNIWADGELVEQEVIQRFRITSEKGRSFNTSGRD
jgi:hypothetical protein